MAVHCSLAVVILLLITVPAWAAPSATSARVADAGHAGPGTSAESPGPPDASSAGVRGIAALPALASPDGYFLENRGQVAAPVRFYAAGNPSVAFRDDGVMFVLRDAGEGAPDAGRGDGPFGLPRLPPERPAWRAYAYLVRFEGASSVSPRGVGELPFRSNFLLGNDPVAWRTGVPAFREVAYEDLYPGIDLVFRPAPAGAKYEFRVRAGADPAAIRVAVEGSRSLAVDASGLVVATPLGDVRDSVPVSWQGDGSAVACGFAARGPSSYGFDCGGRDPSLPLTIDPLVYSTFLGGSDDAFLGYDLTGAPITCDGEEHGASIDVDPQGNAYVYGTTCSIDFPVTPGAYNTTYVEGDRVTGRIGDPLQTFVAKLNRDGSALVYATYIGGLRFAGGAGGGVDIATSIDVDDAGNAYLTGTTYSSDYPTTPGALLRTHQCWPAPSVCDPEAFATKLNAAGDGLVYSTFLGGLGYEGGWGIRVDPWGNAVVAGETNSSLFPTTPGAFDRDFNSYYGPYRDWPDAFVAKLTPSGGGLVYSTYIGGRGWDWPYALAVDGTGAAYVAGVTNSTNFPVTPGANDTTLSTLYDAFVLKLNPNGRTLGYSTFLGGERWENAFGITVDAAGRAYVTGQTNSTEFPTTPGAIRDYLFGGSDAFVTEFDPTGATILYSTFLGGSTFIDRGLGIAVNDLGQVFVSGLTYSVDFPLTPDAFDTQLDGVEGFVAQLDVVGGRVLYATYLGGSDDDEEASSIALDALGVAYVTGWTTSPDFPTTPDAFDRTFGGQGDAFVVKLLPATARDRADLALAPADIAFSPPPPARIGKPVTITATVRNLGGTNATGVLVRFHDGAPTGANQIGGDQVLPFVERFFGSADASVVWSPPSVGVHTIWVVVDPLDTVPELREDNNAASARLEVRPLQPDLALLPADVTLSPPPPYVVGASVQIAATVHNVGDAASPATVVRFTQELAPPPTTIADRPLPAIPVGGSAVVSVTWIASASWTWTLCAIADPDGLVAEMNEGNNTACVAARVLVQPDLRPTAVVIDPAPPLPYGTAASAFVTVLNWGEEAAGPFDVLLFDDGNGNRVPDAGEGLGRGSLVGLAGWDQRTIAVGWTAATPGTRSVCAYADPPPGVVTETNEGNNVRCVAVRVWEPPPTLPDYVPVLPDPTGVLRIGMNTPIPFFIVVRNEGNATGEAATNIVFYNATTPGTPFAAFVVPPLAPGEESMRFAATWVSPATPGTCAIVAAVDPNQVVAEWDEANNAHAWTVEVLGGPMTTLLVGAPNATAAGTTYVTSATLLSLDARDQSGTGIRRTAYRVDNVTWLDYGTTGPFPLAAEGDRYVEWFSEDNANNTEPVAWQVLRVDDTPPATALAVGDPKHVAAETFVTSSTPLTLAAADGGVLPVGVAATEYRIDGAPPWTPYTAPFVVAGEGTHTLEYRSRDLLGNEEGPHAATLVVDDSPPAVSIAVGTPRYDKAETYVTSVTRFTLTATDGGVVPVGVASIEYRLGGAWIPYGTPFTLAGPDGPKDVEYRATDLLGHVAAAQTPVVLDDTPPTTTPSHGDGTYPVGTTFMFPATDAGSGLASTEVRVDGGTWTTYAEPLTFVEGAHTIRFRSVDNLDNIEPERTLSVTISGAPPPSSAETNWKPLVAAVFAAVLALVGAWSSRRAPWPAGTRRRLRAFLLTAAPFVVAEAATGVVSFFTGLLAIPSPVPVGIVVDSGILVAGIAALTYRALKRTPSTGEVEV